VLKVRVFIKYWLPVLIWMTLIFSASGDRESFQHSSRLIGPIIRWLFPHLSEEAVNVGVVVVRKCAHMTEYAMLGLLFWRALRKPVRRDPRPWSWAQAGGSALFVALYAATDEVHQLFVPSRGASVWDVMLDTTGAILGLLLLWMLDGWRRRSLKAAEPGTGGHRN
jgi:VanZ family protein